MGEGKPWDEVPCRDLLKRSEGPSYLADQVGPSFLAGQVGPSGSGMDASLFRYEEAVFRYSSHVMAETWVMGQSHIEHQKCCQRRIQGLGSNSLASERAPRSCRPLGSGSQGFFASYPFPRCYT